MAKFEFKNLEIKKIQNGPNTGNPYMVGTAVNTLFIRDTAQTITEFREEIIDIYKPFIPASKGGTGSEDVKLPDELRYTNGHMATYAPPKELCPFTKRYVTDGTHYVNKVQVPHKAGDIVVNKFGDISLYQEIRVFCEYFMDPAFPGVPSYPNGGSPAEKGDAYFRNFCKSLRETATASEDNDNPIGSIPSQPVSQPTAPEGKKIIGYNQENGQPIYG